MGLNYHQVTEMVFNVHHIDLANYEASFIAKSIEKHFNTYAPLTWPEYVGLLRENLSEALDLAGSMQNSFSEFFRNPLTFAILERVVLPQLISKKAKAREYEVRIWSAACAAGQEPYSLAMLLDELKGSCHPDFRFRIFASDNQESELTKARTGKYGRNTIGKVSMNRIQNYFLPGNTEFEIVPSLKQYVDFSNFDLLTDEGLCPASSIYGNFDLIFCSNLLFYYETSCREKILQKIDKSMSYGGILVTGETEREILLNHHYREVFDNSAIFRKIN